MPVTRNALVRYRTIDNCLRNRQRKWTLEDLIDACSEALYEYEGIDKGVSRRSIQMDIQLMRSDKLGYNAPIVVLEKKYYTYEDPDYSITNIPLTDQDLGKLTEVVEILRQFKGFSHFQDLSGMVQQLENKIHSAKTQQEPIIDFERNDHLKGLEHIETLYQTIINKKAIELCYQSFKARTSNTFTFHPYYLKEYRNRWFVIGIKKKNTPVMNLALDRIISITETSVKYQPRENFTISSLLNNVIGVSVNTEGTTEHVVFMADYHTAPYILTKPLHHSQQLVEKRQDGIVFSIDVQLNFELERELLGFGDRIKVIAPDRLKRNLREIFSNAVDLYQHEFSTSSLQNNLQKLKHKGFMMLNHLYLKKEVNQIKLAVHQHLRSTGQPPDTHAVRCLLNEVPSLRKMIFNTNLLQLLQRIDSRLFLTKAIYFDKTPEANWYVTWHQDIIINVKEKIETEGFTGWTKKAGVHGVCPPDEILTNTITVRIHLDDANEHNGALKVIPGSHQKKLSDEEISVIAQNSFSQTCQVGAGCIHVMKPLLLHSSSKATNTSHRRVIHLEFNTMELPNGLEWAERLELNK
ncbi:MAG: phytanoyl-CoA dioxygenase [Cytophaga sp.]|nr:phytanoyl-CoA dioxygenase [Cytophaga sp.]